MACAYHCIREMIACKATRFIHITSSLNCSDVNTKPLVGMLHHGLLQSVLNGNGVPSLFNWFLFWFSPDSVSSVTPTLV
jgi:hypothetical protein